MIVCMKIGYDHIYESYRELVIHSENISWSRFNNLLVINSILVVAWATLFEHGTSIGAKVVMTFISFLGIFTGVAWAYLGKRSRQYLDRYKEKLQAIEEHHGKADWWEKDIPISDRPFLFEIKPDPSFSSSTSLLFRTPLYFALMNVVLLLATWFRC